MQLLRLKDKDLAMLNHIASTLVRRSTISDLKGDKREDVLDQLNDIVILFVSVSYVLETVDGHYAELTAHPTAASIIAESGKKKLPPSHVYRSQPDVFSEETRAALEFLSQKNQARDKAGYSWYRYLELMVEVYNELVAVYGTKSAKIHEIEQQTAQVARESRYSLTLKQLQDCHDAIKKFGTELEELVRSYYNVMAVHTEVRRHCSDDGSGNLTNEQHKVYKNIMHTIKNFRVWPDEDEEVMYDPELEPPVADEKEEAKEEREEKQAFPDGIEEWEGAGAYARPSRVEEPGEGKEEEPREGPAGAGRGKRWTKEEFDRLLEQFLSLKSPEEMEDFATKLYWEFNDPAEEAWQRSEEEWERRRELLERVRRYIRKKNEEIAFLEKALLAGGVLMIAALVAQWYELRSSGRKR